MARSALGTKRVCPTTGRKFYDLNKDPIISPYTGQVVTIATPARARAEAVPATVAPVIAEVELEPAVDDAELISLEEADDETSAAKDIPDEDIEDDPAVDDAFLEEEEDEGEDVTDLIGDTIDDGEEP